MRKAISAIAVAGLFALAVVGGLSVLGIIPQVHASGCVTDLKATEITSSGSSATIKLTWSPFSAASSYAIFSSTDFGAYSFLLSTTNPGVTITVIIGHSYSYYVEPEDEFGNVMCQSNIATVQATNFTGVPEFPISVLSSLLLIGLLLPALLLVSRKFRNPLL